MLSVLYLLGGDINVWDVVILAQHRKVGHNIYGRDVSGNNTNPAGGTGTR